MHHLPPILRSLLAPLLGCGLVALIAPLASAQNQGLVVRDGTLGSAPAGVVPPGPDDLGTADYLIRADLGEQRGSNLFHSFARFSIGSGERATFSADGAPNAGAIKNVISRVSGGSPSEIDGTLHSSIPGADLWLLNPSGVVFGAGARLDVPGSFHASTGAYVRLGDGDLQRFYSDPSRPSVLSTAKPLAFGFLSGSGAALIAVEGSQLAVDPRETLELVGGNLSLTGAELTTSGGNVSLAAQGTVGFSDSVVNVGGDTPGSASIRAGRLVMTHGSKLLAENEGAGPGGRIDVEASESVLVDASLLSVSTHGAGNAGTILMESPEVKFQNGPGFDPLEPPQIAEVGASAETTSGGAAGEIQIHAGELMTLTNGVGVSATAVGPNASGDAGAVEFVAQEVSVALGSRVFAETAGAGAGGNISIKAGEKVVVDEGLLSVNTWSAGKAGTIRIAGLGKGLPSPDVTIQNGPGLPSIDNPRVTERGLRAQTTSSGAGGEIYIDAGALAISHGVAVDTTAIGSTTPVARGDAGSVEINAHSVEVSDRSYIGAAGWGSTGRAGSIHIDLGDMGSLVVDGKTDAAQVPAPLYAPQYAWIITSSAGIPGKIEIQGDSVTAKNGGGIHSNCNPGCTANPSDETGAIQIAANGIHLVEGGSIFAYTFGARLGGDITLSADSVTIESGGVVNANTSGTGNGGDIAIDASSITIGSEGAINVETTGVGNAGDISLHASSITIGSGGLINAETGGVGNAGGIDLRTDSLAIETKGTINASSRFGGGDAGAIAVTATDSIFLTNEDGDPFDLGRFLNREISLSGIFSATVGGGEGGSIKLKGPEITVTDGAIVATSTIGGGQGGAIDLLGDRIRIVNGGFVDTTSGLLPQGGVAISGGQAGDVTLVASKSIEVGGGSEFGQLASDGISTLASRVASEGLGTGDAGAVLLQAPRIELFDGGTLAIDSTDADGGDVTVLAKKLVHLDAGVITASVTTGKGGNITIDPEVVLLENGSRIEARAGAGTGGNIQITTDNYFAFPGSLVSVAADSELGIDGTLEIHAPDVSLAGTLTPLPTSYLDAASLMRERCAVRKSGESAGSFAVRGSGGIPPEPDGWLPASFDVASGPLATPLPRTEPAAAPLFALRSCL